MSRIRFLVTGGAGFIGSNIVARLLNLGYDVRVVDNFSTGKRENLSPVINDIELIEGDIRSLNIAEKAVKGIDIIIHQAALPSVPRSIADPITTNEVNVGGTINILEAAVKNKARKFVMASSSSIYGDNPDLPRIETMPPNPASPYAVSKMAAEKYCEVYSQLYGLETITLRYFNVFGPNQDPTSEYSAVIPRFIYSAIKNISPVIYGDGKQSRDFVFVDNVVEANIRAAFADGISGIVLNCAGHEQITINRVVELISDYLEKSIYPLYKNPRPGDVKHSFASIQAARDIIGYQPEIDFKAGLEKTIKYFIDLIENDSLINISG